MEGYGLIGVEDKSKSNPKDNFKTFLDPLHSLFFTEFLILHVSMEEV